MARQTKVAAAAAAAKPTPTTEPAAEVQAAAPAAAFPDLGLIEKLLPVEFQAIFDLFDADFHLFEVWNALEAIAGLGRKAEAFLGDRAGPKFGATGGPELIAVIPSDHVMTAELCDQLRAELGIPAADPDAAPAVGGAVAAANAPPVAMNPILAGLIVALAKRAAEELIRRLGGLLNR